MPEAIAKPARQLLMELPRACPKTAADLFLEPHSTHHTIA